MKLGQASHDEREAAFNVIYWDLMDMLKELPGFVQGQVRDKLNSTDGRARILKVMDDAYDAAEKVRNKAAPRDDGRSMG